MILCCGEALIDMIPSATKSGRDGFVPHSGGAVFNTAIALGRLGARVGLLTALSSDIFGQQLLRDLKTSRVDPSLTVDTDRPTTLAFVRLEDGQARYAFFDENSANRMLTYADFPEIPAEVDTLFFGGISLAVEPGAAAFAELAAKQGKGRVIMIDPNIRPGFIRDPLAYRARLLSMITGADIVKISDEDLDWLVPGSTAVDKRVESLRGEGPSVVIVTRGSAGADAWLRDGTKISVPSRKVDVADTVGAGDTFNAGILAHLAEAGLLTRDAIAAMSPKDVTAAVAFGAAVAAVTVSRTGADAPWRHEVLA